MAEASLRIADMTWPNPEHAGDLEWKLRYVEGHITRGDQLTAAAILNAYRELVSMPTRLRNRRVTQIRAAMKALGGRSDG